MPVFTAPLKDTTSDSLINPLQRVAGAVIDNSIGSVLSTADGHISSVLEESYGGTGTTAFNATPSPNSGAAQAEYDATFVTGLEPVFTGTAGTAGAYFFMGSNKIFEFETKSTLANEMHEYQERDWGILYAIRMSNSGSFIVPLSNGGKTGTDYGLEFLMGGTFTWRVNINNLGGRVVNTFGDLGTYTNGVDYLLGLSYNSSTNELTAFRGGYTGGQTLTGAMSDNSGSKVDSATNWRTNRSGSTSTGFGAGGRVYDLTFIDGQISSSDFIAAKTYYEGLHGITFS